MGERLSQRGRVPEGDRLIWLGQMKWSEIIKILHNTYTLFNKTALPKTNAYISQKSCSLFLNIFYFDMAIIFWVSILSTLRSLGSKSTHYKSLFYVGPDLFIRDTILFVAYIRGHLK